MALYFSGSPIANVALTDTFNTWRQRTNQINLDAISRTDTGVQTLAGGLSVGANNTTFAGITIFTANTQHSGIFNHTSTINSTVINNSGPMTAPIVTANSFVGPLTGDVTGSISGTSGTFTGLVSAPTFNANNLGGTLTTAAQGNITSVGTLTSLTSSGNITGVKGIYSGPVTTPVVTANTVVGSDLDVNGNADISGDLVIHGDFTVNGNTTTISVETLAVDDNIIYLNANSTVTNPDLGFSGNYNDGTYAHAGLFRDASDAGTFKFFTGYVPEPNTEINTAHGTFELANVAMNGIVASSANVGILTITDNIKFNNFMREEVSIAASAATGTINYNVKDATVVYYTSDATGNWTLNIRGDASNSLDSLMSTGESLSLVFIASQGSSAYYQSGFQIDGSSNAIQWINDTAPSAGVANGLDVYSFTIIKTGAATFTVLGSLNSYG